MEGIAVAAAVVQDQCSAAIFALESSDSHWNSEEDTHLAVIVDRMVDAALLLLGSDIAKQEKVEWLLFDFSLQEDILNESS